MNINYSHYNKEKAKLSQELWNKDIGFIFPITDKAFNQNVINCKYIDEEASLFAFDNDKLVGFIICKRWDDDVLIENYKDTAWVTLFYVTRDYRKKGICKYLFSYIEKKFKEKNIKQIYIGRDINNFFPAVPCDFDNITFQVLEKLGYTAYGITHDIIKINDGKLYNISNNFNIRFAEENDKENVLTFLKENFPGRWHYEAMNYYDDGGYVIALKDNVIVGFMRINTLKNNDVPYNIMWSERFGLLGGLGPLGVDKNFRKHGVGSDLLAWSINYLIKCKVTHIMIDWTSLLLYYQKYNFEVWKCYRYYGKRLQ